MKKYPLDANKISIAGVALDGTTLERSAQLETDMIAGKYDNAKDASLAALQWYQDSRTPKTVQNRNRLTQLLDTAESVERGDYTEINKGLTELLGQLKGEFSGNEFIISNTGQLNDNGSRKVTDFYNKAKLEKNLCCKRCLLSYGPIFISFFCCTSFIFVKNKLIFSYIFRFLVNCF